MKLSARNQLKGIVKQVNTGSVNTEIILELAPGVEITSIITKTSAENLGIKVGKQAFAIVKASNVIIGVDE